MMRDSGEKPLRSSGAARDAFRPAVFATAFVVRLPFSFFGFAFLTGLFIGTFGIGFLFDAFLAIRPAWEANSAAVNWLAVIRRYLS